MKIIKCDICGSEIKRRDTNEASHVFVCKTGKEISVKTFFCEDCIYEAITKPSVFFESETVMTRIKKRIEKLEAQSAPAAEEKV